MTSALVLSWFLTLAYIPEFNGVLREVPQDHVNRVISNDWNEDKVYNSEIGLKLRALKYFELSTSIETYARKLNGMSFDPLMSNYKIEGSINFDHMRVFFGHECDHMVWSGRSRSIPEKNETFIGVMFSGSVDIWR